MTTFIDTPHAAPSIYEDARWDALCRSEFGVTVWEIKTAAEVYDDVRAVLAGTAPGLDRQYIEFFQSRPFGPIPAFETLTPIRKVPPVIAHAPPARRGRWSRG